MLLWLLKVRPFPLHYDRMKWCPLIITTHMHVFGYIFVYLFSFIDVSLHIDIAFHINISLKLSQHKWRFRGVMASQITIKSTVCSIASCFDSQFCCPYFKTYPRSQSLGRTMSVQIITALVKCVVFALAAANIDCDMYSDTIQGWFHKKKFQLWV